MQHQHLTLCHIFGCDDYNGLVIFYDSPERLLRKVVVGLEIRKKGSLLMDIPNDIRSMDDLIDCAMDRQKWQIEVGALRKQLNIECNP